MKLGIFVGEDRWTFFREIYEDLAAHYQTEIYKRRTYNAAFLHDRINRWAYMKGMRDILRRSDVCFFEWASEYLMVASHMPKQCSIVTRLHRFEMYQWVDKINWENVDKIIIVSQAKKEEFIGRFPEHAYKAVVINESIDFRKFLYNPKPFKGNIGILCHLTPRKRVYELIITFSELIKQRDYFHLHIGGGPHSSHRDYYTAINSVVRDLGLEDKVTFYGNIAEPWDWYNLIDIFISNSYSEGLQVAPMEAMASGCYCLSHHWDGADEMFPEENLYITDSELLQKLIDYYEMSDEEKSRCIEHLRSIAIEKFNIEETKDLIRQVIEEVGASHSKL